MSRGRWISSRSLHLTLLRNVAGTWFGEAFQNQSYWLAASLHWIVRLLATGLRMPQVGWWPTSLTMPLVST
jgi:hypothetical protein